MVATRFLSAHPRKGEPTGFEEAIINGTKIHTLRGNYEYWRKRVENVQKGLAYFSLRKWEGKPRQSAQIEIKQFHAEDGVGIIPVEKRNGGQIWHYQDPNDLFSNPFPLKPLGNKNLDLAKNDGLAIEDFMAWFEKAEKYKPMALIYFTTFRYA